MYRLHPLSVFILSFIFLNIALDIFFLFDLFLSGIITFAYLHAQQKNQKLIEINKINSELRAFENFIDQKINEHEEILIMKFSQGNIQDSYGRINNSKWQREIKYFINEIIEDELRENLDERKYSIAEYAIDNEVRKRLEKKESLLSNLEKVDPEKFLEKNYSKIKIVIDSEISRHRLTLIKKYQMEVEEDEYGSIIDDRWQDSLDYFINEIIINKNSLAINDILSIISRKYIENQINKEIKKAANKFKEMDIENLTGSEFEQACLFRFRNIGWDGYQTKGSGDHGADLVIHKNDRTVVIQCKRYSSKVGNAAVQEVYAAKAIYKAEFAAVVTNNSYTPAARQAAKLTNVFLLNFNNLDEIDEKVEKYHEYILDELNSN